MPPVNDDLLVPTLTGAGHQAHAIYSRRTLFLSTFFGGPIGGAIVTGVNAHRLGRLSKDAWLVALGIALPVVVLWWQTSLGGGEWLRSTIGRTGARIPGYAAAFGYYGISFLAHRQFYRNMEFAGIDPPSGRQVGLTAVLVGLPITVGLGLLFSL